MSARPVPVMPIPAPCCFWPEGGRCRADATVWLIQPDGEPNPGGYYCRHHGEATVTEYREKIGQRWTLTEISRDPYAVTTKRAKAAVIRDPAAPLGAPAAFSLRCDCGATLTVDFPVGVNVLCPCGAAWTARGYRVEPPAVPVSLAAPTRPQSVVDAILDAATLETIARHHNGDGLLLYRLHRAGQCGTQAVERLSADYGCDELAALDATAAAEAAFAAIPELRPEEDR